MIVYCDSSALIKGYIDEANTPDVVALLAAAEHIAVCRIAWTECHAAFARRFRHASVTEQAIATARADFARNWPGLVVIEVSQSVVERGGDYADTFALRAYDAVQLAAAHELALSLGEAVTFACFDRRLNKAAKVLGLIMPFVEYERI
ncbi:MAG: type II toxin-antitoxin system VapC family toxin [Nitrococcus sp.]|nr:type II toxin-antitoxin system VapC family toxin [Nitrococcus sp.]